MDLDQVREASDALVSHWRHGTVLQDLPDNHRPQSRLEGYAIQAQLERLSAKPLWGWKIAATSLAGQKHIGVDGPLVGRLLAEMVHPAGSTLSCDTNHMRVAEPEFAFRMGHALKPRQAAYTVDEVMNAVAAMHLAIEVPDSRFGDFTKAGAAQLIADNACAHQFVIGPEAPAWWRKIDLAEHRVVGRVSERIERDGKGANVLGDPRLALTWMANELSKYGMTLDAGQIVTTGTCVVPLEIMPGDAVTANFGPLGEVRVQFSPLA